MLLSNNRYSYHTTLVALSKEQQFDKAFEVFAAMKEDGVLPDATVYSSIVHAVVVSQHACERVYHMMSSTPCSANSKVAAVCC
eukprot:15453-Heterococcus_DN1.PRE.3